MLLPSRVLLFFIQNTLTLLYTPENHYPAIALTLTRLAYNFPNSSATVWWMVLWMVMNRSRVQGGSRDTWSDTIRYAKFLTLLTLFAQIIKPNNGILLTKHSKMVVTFITRTDLTTLWSVSISTTQFFNVRCVAQDITMVTVNGMT